MSRVWVDVKLFYVELTEKFREKIENQERKNDSINKLNKHERNWFKSKVNLIIEVSKNEENKVFSKEIMSKILFVDDDQSTLILMNRATEILGHQSFTCSEPENAIKHVDHTHPDLILIDINMQGVNGFQVVQQIRHHANASSLPVLIVSAGDPMIEGEKAVEAGANGFISKPLSISKLDSAIKQYAMGQKLIGCPSF